MIKKSTIKKVLNEDLAEIWDILNPDERRVVINNFKIETFRKGQRIYAEGEMPENLWCVLDGKVKMYKDGVGRQQILRLYNPGQYFGYRAFFANELYVSSVVASEESQVGYIDMNIVSEIIDNNMKLAWFFIRELSGHLGRSDTRLVNLTQKHLRGRLAEALMVLYDNYGLEDDKETLRMCMSRDDLAAMSNMTTANAIRTLTTFSNEKVISVDGRIIKILDLSKLKRISKNG